MDKIWTFAENQNINTDNIDLKQFKPTGKFFEMLKICVKKSTISKFILL